MASKKNQNIVSYEDVDFSQLMIEEVKENEYSKYQLLSLPKFKYSNGVMGMLYLKTPMMNYTIGGFPPAKDKEGNELFKDESERAKWRCYLGNTPEEKKMYEKMVELQDKLIKEKSLIVGKKDEKKFELENIIGETSDKEGNPMYYIRYNFRTNNPPNNAPKEITTSFFVTGNPDPISIKSVSEFESKFRRGTFRYRMIISLNKVWRQKKLPGKYGASFKIEQMQIEQRDDIPDMNGNINMKNLFLKSQFDDDDEEDTKDTGVNNITTKTSKMLIKEDIESADADDEDNADDDDEDEDTKKLVTKMAEKKKVMQEIEDDDEEEEDEIKPTKKSVAAKAKPVRRKATASSSS